MTSLVSIVCITYNQEDFIRETLDSFVSQVTTFPFEVLIHDDASTDNTVNIIRDYADRYPEVIKPVFEKENQYSKGTFEFVNELFVSAQGKYIAMCEGDDYWTDNYKLQKQVDFLEKHPEYNLCFHSVEVIYDDGSRKSEIVPADIRPSDFTISKLLENNFIYTCSVMYRKGDYEKIAHSVLPQDIYLHLFHIGRGRIGFLKDTMAVYRKQSSGVWWDSGKRMTNIYKKYRFQSTNLFSQLLTLPGLNAKHRSIIYRHINYLFNTFIDIDSKEKSLLLEETARDFPGLVAHFVAEQKSFINELQTENQRLSKDVHELLPAAKELEDIKKSRWYRLNPGYRKNS